MKNTDVAELKVKGVVKDQLGNPVVLLEPLDGIKKILPISVGHSEAFSIALALNNEKFDRPLTHDLLKNVILGFNSTLEYIVITKLENQTYYAKLRLKKSDPLTNQTQIIEIDGRPSDSIALALRFNAPVYAALQVIEQGGQDLENIEYE